MKTQKNGLEFSHHFFTSEYSLDYYASKISKCQVVFWNGISSTNNFQSYFIILFYFNYFLFFVLFLTKIYIIIIVGGGLGISMYSKYKVATEKSVYAMPEVCFFTS